MTPPPMILFGLLGAAVARIVISMLWYSPMLFWSTWSRHAGVSKAAMRQGMGKGFAIHALGSLLMAFVLLHAIFYAGARTVPLALAVSFANWLGFVAVVHLQVVSDEKKSFFSGIFAARDKTLNRPAAS